MRYRRRGLPILIAVGLSAMLIAGLLALFPARVARAGTINVDPTQVQSKDPTSITFTARVRAPAGLKAARFTYKVLNPDGNIGGGGEAQFSPGAESDVTFTLTAKDSTRYIPVGSDFQFHWSLTDGDGIVLETKDEPYRFLDGRYQWQTRTDGPVIAYWYGNDDKNAMTALGAAKSALIDTTRLLKVQTCTQDATTGVRTCADELPYKLKVIVWRSEAEGQLAMQSRGSSFDSRVLTGGQRVAPDLIFVFSPQVDVIRHEAAHAVSHVAGDGPFTSIPSWLDEGNSVYAQTSPGQGYTSGVDFAIQTDTTLRLRSLQSPVNNPELVNAFYGQSWSTVKFIIDTHGRDKYAQIFKAIHDGMRTDDALKQVIGMDQDGLYNAWRQANRLPPKVFAPESAGTASAAGEATRAPLSIPTSVGSGGTSGATPAAGEGAGANAEGTGASGAGAAIAIGGMTVLLAVLLGGGGLYLMRRRSGPPAR